MPHSATISDSATIGSETYTAGRTVTFDNKIDINPTVTAAKTGTLTTRTDDDTGTLTMTSGHGITTGALVDIWWDSYTKRRVNVVVGTVSVDSVPIDGGSGDVLPAVDTAVTVKVQHSEDVTVTGNNVKLIIVDSNTPNAATFAQSGGTVIAAVETDTVNANGRYTYRWDEGSGVTNPLAGATVGKVRLSHGDSAASHDIKVLIGYS